MDNPLIYQSHHLHTTIISILFYYDNPNLFYANKIYNFYAKEILENNLIGCSLQNFKQNVVNWRNSDKYQRTTLNNPYVSAYNGVSASGFDVYEYSSSVDPTGSYLAPYITTIGLYDDNMDMVAVAKLATPIKSTPDLPVNFLVRFDT